MASRHIATKHTSDRQVFDLSLASSTHPMRHFCIYCHEYEGDHCRHRYISIPNHYQCNPCEWIPADPPQPCGTFIPSAAEDACHPR